MKTIKIFTVIIVAIFSMSILYAQENEGEILTTTEITVKQGHHAQFIEGVKAWKACYLENNGKEDWNMWHRQQGEGNFYIMSGNLSNWAEMDKEDPSSEACYITLINLIMPHIEKVNSRIARHMPNVSSKSSATPKYINVTYYQVHKEYLFEEVVSTVTEAIKSKEGAPRGEWYHIKFGGPETADFIFAYPFNKYAEMDVKRDSPAKIHTDLVGEEKAAALWEKWFETLENSWSYTYKLNSDMSN